MRPSSTALLLAFSLLMVPEHAHAQASKKELKDVLKTWGVLSKNIKINKVTNTKDDNGERTLGGNVTVFGQRCGLEVSFYKADRGRPQGGSSEIREVAIDFPEKAKLTTRHFRDLFQTDPAAIFPGIGGAGISIKHLAVGVQNKKIESARIVVGFGTWMPGGKGSAKKQIRLTDLEGDFGLENIQGSVQLTAGVKSYMFLPENLAQTMGIGATSLELSGRIVTKPMAIELGANLASREIPLDPKKSVVLKNARLMFQFRGGKPALALGGKIEVRPPKQAPIGLNGEVSIDPTGSIYAAGWMDQSAYWQNPFGISNAIRVEKAGLGFGANFATAIPTPIIAIEGGLKIQDPRTGRVRAEGAVTLGLNTANPTQTVIDAEVGTLKFSEFVGAFQATPIPREFTKTLNQITLHKVRFAFVPPGPGVTLFGVDYQPALTAEADCSFGDFRGTMYIAINEAGVEAFAGMTPLRGNGFAFTGTKAGTGPYMYIALKPKERVLALAINGKVQVVGANALTDIYLSDAGFSGTVKTNILGGFSASVDVAGTALTKNAGLYVSATMTDRDGLVQKISKVASAQIKQAAQATDRDFNTKRKALEALRPKLAAKKRQLTAKQNQVRQDYQRLCGLLDQRRAQEAEKRRKQSAISALKTKIRNDEANLRNNLYKRAKNLRSLSCPGGHGKHKNYCWSCPRGTKHDILQPWDGSKACFKPRPFPQGPLYYRAKKGGYVGCKNPLIPDIGRCWECPKGYVRKVSVHRIDSAKACDMKNSEAVAVRIAQDRTRLAAMETELATITQGIGRLASQLSGVAANTCDKVKNTDAINADPRVAPTFAQWADLSLQVNEGQAALDALRQTAVGTMNTAAWITKNAGKGLSVVRVEEASFEGCASVLKGGKVAMKIKGKMADKPFQGAFDVQLQRPDAAIRTLADTLLAQKTPTAKGSNGNCKRPNIPRPKLGGTKIGDKLAALNRSKKNLKPRPSNKQAKRPTWSVSVAKMDEVAKEIAKTASTTTTTTSPTPSPAAPTTTPGTPPDTTPTNPGRPGTPPIVVKPKTPTRTGPTRPEDPKPAPTRPAPTTPAPTNPAPAPAPEPSPPAKPVGPTCAEATQKKIPWDYRGNRYWYPKNLAVLCDGSTSAEPAWCFQEVMHRNVDWGGGTKWKWQNAARLCARSPNARNTVNCFKGKVRSQGWEKAIDSCRATGAATPSRTPPPAPPSGGTTCVDATQKKIPWDYRGNRYWNPKNLALLCDGSKNAEPASCFREVMHRNVDWGGGTRWMWQNAVKLCARSSNARKTVDCFKGKVRAQGWAKAIDTCRAR